MPLHTEQSDAWLMERCNDQAEVGDGSGIGMNVILAGEPYDD